MKNMHHKADMILKELTNYFNHYLQRLQIKKNFLIKKLKIKTKEF